VDLVESLAKESGEEGKKFLKYGDGTVGFVASGGFLAPAFAGDSVATWSPPDDTATWLDETQVRELEPNLHPEVVGGWWFPEDASVDARRLTCALRAACIAAGVDIKIGKDFEVQSLDLLNGECRGLYLQSGKYIKTKSVLVANGSWMRQLLPVPIEPHKGQSISLKMPTDKPPILKRVLFAQDSYIVPKSDGRIVVGATVEAGSFDPNVTPAGIMHILHHALQLVPGLGDLPIEETWAGLRPTTPDKGPILGKTQWNNVFLAGGYWRNGVLLAPKTGQMLAQVIAGQELSPSDQALLDAFGWDRFTSIEGGKKMAMNARYAASMHPVHRRAQGAGIAAAVGTELGSYSTARSSSQERAKDRASLFGDLDDVLEKAALMGKDDAKVFSGYESSYDLEETAQSSRQPRESFASMQAAKTSPYEGSVDAITVPGEKYDDDLSEMYKAIQTNQARRIIEMGPGNATFERSDPGFRIYYEEPSTGEKSEIPPFTPLDEIEKMMEKLGMPPVETRTSLPKSNDKANSLANGKQIIQESQSTSFKTYPEVLESSQDLTEIYKQIQQNKASKSVQFNDSSISEQRPDPGFRIYYENPETGGMREVPPYTSPDEVQQLVEKQSGMHASSSPTETSMDDKKSATDFETIQEYSERTFDGYTAIQQSNSRISREEELKAMKAARQKNRFLGNVDVSKIGVKDFGTES
jgi:thiazole synthase